MVGDIAQQQSIYESQDPHQHCQIFFFNYKKLEPEVWLTWKSACLASMKPQVWPKKELKDKNMQAGNGGIHV
jgi:hypothetical protein